MQHDVQELNRVLCDNLEEKMKVSWWKQGPVYHCKDQSFTNDRPVFMPYIAGLTNLSTSHSRPLQRSQNLF